MCNDIRRAYFFADVKGDLFVELPQEAETEGMGEVCAKLKKSLWHTGRGGK